MPPRRCHCGGVGWDGCEPEVVADGAVFAAAIEADAFSVPRLGEAVLLDAIARVVARRMLTTTVATGADGLRPVRTDRLVPSLIPHPSEPVPAGSHPELEQST